MPSSSNISLSAVCSSINSAYTLLSYSTSCNETGTKNIHKTLYLMFLPRSYRKCVLVHIPLLEKVLEEKYRKHLLNYFCHNYVLNASYHFCNYKFHMFPTDWLKMQTHPLFTVCVFSTNHYSPWLSSRNNCDLGPERSVQRYIFLIRHPSMA